MKIEHQLNLKSKSSARDEGTVVLAVGALVILIALITCLSVIARSYRRASLEICSLIADHYFAMAEERTVEFVRECRMHALGDTLSWSKEANVRRINRFLHSFGVSHLALYSPPENRALWENAALRTGLKTEIVEDRLVVFDVVSGSPADRAGFRRGDVIVSRDGTPDLSSADVEDPGDYESIYIVRRLEDGRAGENASEIAIRLRPEDLNEDLSPRIEFLSAGVVRLKIPSFLPQYFEKENWLKLVYKLQTLEAGHQLRGIVIDLRGNAGGSFPAMLRALSPFRCREPDVGVLMRSRTESRTGVESLRDELDVQSQLDQLERAYSLSLRTFPGYGCLATQMIVLVDHGTSSVAEIFAQSLAEHRNSHVWGQVTAGQVNLAEWFSVEGFGAPTYSLSIPVADVVVKGPHGESLRLEGLGVRPDRELFYDLDSVTRGHDNWLESAAGTLSRL